GYGDMMNRGDGPGEMGEQLPIVDLGTGRCAVSIALGGQHTCALLENGAVKCWGDNTHGQLGQGDVDARGDGPYEMGDNLTEIRLGTDQSAVAITVGQSFSCALLIDNSLKCWGANDKY